MFHYERGDLENALKSFVRARDYCATVRHTTDLCLNVIRVSLEMRKYSNITVWSNIALKYARQNTDPLVLSKVSTHCLTGRQAGINQPLATSKLIVARSFE